MLILGHDEVLAALSPEECAAAMADVLAARARGEALMPLRSAIRPMPKPETFIWPDRVRRMFVGLR